MWILIQSLPPRAEKENERRTGRHPRRPRNGPRRARRQGKTILCIQGGVAQRRRLSPVDFEAPRSRRARSRENRSVPVGASARQRNGARSLGAQIPSLGEKRVRAHGTAPGCICVLVQGIPGLRHKIRHNFRPVRSVARRGWQAGTVQTRASFSGCRTLGPSPTGRWNRRYLR
jgi:hypothetical protein